MRGDDVFAKFLALDDRLVAAGFHRTSEWWKATLARFLRSNVRTLVARVGRRGGKSSTLCRLAVLLAIFVDHDIPAGDIGVVAFVSTRKDEAAARLFTIKKILDAIGVRYSERGDDLDIDGRPVKFKVLACTVAAVSGFTSIAVIADEVAKWRDTDSGANPATEVLAALRPTMATQPHARMVLSSSPVGADDAHAVAFDRGDTDAQITAFAPTWIANPSLTEEQTHRDEPDERIWRREYGALAQMGALSAFEPEAIDRAFAWRPLARRLGAPVTTIDPAGKGTNFFTACIASYAIQAEAERDRYLADEVSECPGAYVIRRSATGAPVPNPDFRPPLPFMLIDQFVRFDASFRAEIGVEEVTRRVAVLARSAGARDIVSDSYEAFSLEGWFQRHDRTLRFVGIPTTTGSKAQAINRLRRMLNERAISFVEPSGMLRREMLAFEERVGANGIHFGGRDPVGGHFDHLSAVVAAMSADIDGRMYGSAGFADNRLFGGYGHR